MINVKLGLLIQDCRKNVKFCYCVYFRSGYKVQSGLIQIPFFHNIAVHEEKKERLSVAYDEQDEYQVS